MRLLRFRRQVGCRGPLLPHRYDLLVDPVVLGLSPQALLTMLYRLTDRCCRRGAPMVNWSIAHPSIAGKDCTIKSGIKHRDAGGGDERDLLPAVRVWSSEFTSTKAHTAYFYLTTHTEHGLLPCDLILEFISNKYIKRSPIFPAGRFEASCISPFAALRIC